MKKLRMYVAHSVALVSAFALPLIVRAQLTLPEDLPISKKKSVTQVIPDIIGWILAIVGSIAILSLIYGGVLYIISAGNEKEVEKAKNILKWSIVGLIIILLAYTIIQTVNNVF